MVAMHVAEYAEITPSPEATGSYLALPWSTPDDYRQLAALLVDRWINRCRIVGISGSQGSGKSTLGRLIAQSAEEHRGLRTCVLSIDDFYLPKVDRQRLAEEEHPLLITRGPPGTHDVSLCMGVLRNLFGDGEVEIPHFDKGLDDRVAGERVTGPMDLVVLEGWCVGAAPAPGESDEPINELEREEDPDGEWREYVEKALAENYQSLFGMLDEVVFMKAPDFDAARRWRFEQESERPEEQRMTQAQVDQFVQYYERITRRMLKDLGSEGGSSADAVVTLGEDHAITGLSVRG